MWSRNNTRSRQQFYRVTHEPSRSCVTLTRSVPGAPGLSVLTGMCSGVSWVRLGADVYLSLKLVCKGSTSQYWFVLPHAVYTEIGPGTICLALKADMYTGSGPDFVCFAAIPCQIVLPVETRKSVQTTQDLCLKYCTKCSPS